MARTWATRRTTTKPTPFYAQRGRKGGAVMILQGLKSRGLSLLFRYRDTGARLWPFVIRVIPGKPGGLSRSHDAGDEPAVPEYGSTSHLDRAPSLPGVPVAGPNKVSQELLTTESSGTNIVAVLSRKRVSSSVGLLYSITMQNTSIHPVNTRRLSQAWVSYLRRASLPPLPLKWRGFQRGFIQ